MEHAAGYHFAFLKLLGEIHDYCEQISSVRPEQLQRLVDYRDRLRYAAYFLQDHDGNVPEIGDSDSLVVGESNGWYRVAEPPHDKTVFFDPEAGYAIYKGHPSTRDRRYVVFTNQSQHTKLKFHRHDDALAVFYDYDGEIILGDQGRFEYSQSAERRYFVSPLAHNTVFPANFLMAARGQFVFSLANAVGHEEDGDAVRFNAHTRYRRGIFVNRSVAVRRGEKTLCVQDSIRILAAGVSGTDVVRDTQIRPESVQKVLEERRRLEQRLERQLVMVWNIGRDVESVQLEETETGEPFELSLKTRRGRRFRVSIEFAGDYNQDSLSVELARGERLPMRGWYSPQMLVIRPSPSLIITFEPTGSMNITTRVELAGRKPFPGLGPLLRGY
jgi:hypothetical protein